MAQNASDISVVIPTYERGTLVVDTIELLLNQSERAGAIIVVDQTQYVASDPVASTLAKLHDAGDIEWVKLNKPSIPAAMNVGLMQATTPWVLFLDDDILISDLFISEHAKALTIHDCPAHVGGIHQPNEQFVARADNYHSGDGLLVDLEFPFNSDTPAQINNCMAGNLMVSRQQALDCGGFDENFVGAAYRFETEFCQRLVDHSGKPFYFAPRAKIDHLKAARGGTRKMANFLTSIKPDHSVGDYYFALLRGRKGQAIVYCLRRYFSAIYARFYLTNPWYIPSRIIAETRGILLAIKLRTGFPKHVNWQARDR